MAETPARIESASTVPARIWEIDFLRGLAILLMLLYHAGFDLTELAGIRRAFGIVWDLNRPGFQIAVVVFAGLFILLCGISSTLTRSNFRRGWRLLAVAALVTAASFLFNREETIYFGILHCLGVCILIYGAAFQNAKPRLLAEVGLFVVGLSFALPALLRGTPVRFNWLAPFGIISDTFSSFDYFPLLPWFGIFLIGAALGKTLYAGKRSLVRRTMPANVINFAGRHTLLIYVIHQPVFLAILFVLGRIKL